MVISFLGSPVSGKTTTAALVFSKLKEAGLPVEFLPEQARLYIAEERYRRGLKPSDRLELTDDDQLEIMRRQISIERLYRKVCGSGVTVVTDSCPLNSFLYMSENAREENREELFQSLGYSDVLFYSPPVWAPKTLDPNRIHSQEEALTIDSRIPMVLERYAPGKFPVELHGLPILRAAEVLTHIFRVSDV